MANLKKYAAYTSVVCVVLLSASFAAYKYDQKQKQLDRFARDIAQYSSETEQWKQTLLRGVSAFSFSLDDFRREFGSAEGVSSSSLYEPPRFADKLERVRFIDRREPELVGSLATEMEEVQQTATQLLSDLGDLIDLNKQADPTDLNEYRLVMERFSQARALLQASSSRMSKQDWSYRVFQNTLNMTYVDYSYDDSFTTLAALEDVCDITAWQRLFSEGRAAGVAEQFLHLFADDLAIDCSDEREALFDLFFSNGVNANTPNPSNGLLPIVSLYKGAMHAGTPLYEKFLKAGADLNRLDANGKSALYYFMNGIENTFRSADFGMGLWAIEMGADPRELGAEIEIVTTNVAQSSLIDKYKLPLLNALYSAGGKVIYNTENSISLQTALDLEDEEAFDRILQASPDMVWSVNFERATADSSDAYQRLYTLGRKTIYDNFDPNCDSPDIEKQAVALVRTITPDAVSKHLKEEMGISLDPLMLAHFDFSSITERNIDIACFEADEKTQNTLGYYVPFTNKVYINQDLIGDKDAFVNVLVHELTHYLDYKRLIAEFPASVNVVNGFLLQDVFRDALLARHQHRDRYGDLAPVDVYNIEQIIDEFGYSQDTKSIYQTMIIAELLKEYSANILPNVLWKDLESIEVVSLDEIQHARRSDDDTILRDILSNYPQLYGYPNPSNIDPRKFVDLAKSYSFYDFIQTFIQLMEQNEGIDR